MNISKTQQWADVGGLSSPSKMPCYGYSIPAQRCITGSKLAIKIDTVCSNCYARHGRYLFGNVKRALERRFQTLTDPDWVNNMVFLINNSGQSYFRWHDSGDIQGQWHLNNIVAIANKCPDVKFWLPTKEMGMISKWKDKHGNFPDNLCVRISAPIKETQLAARFGPSSMVIKDPTLPIAKNIRRAFTLCEAFNTDGKCGTCRKCWDKSVSVIAYKEH